METEEIEAAFGSLRFGGVCPGFQLPKGVAVFGRVLSFLFLLTPSVSLFHHTQCPLHSLRGAVLSGSSVAKCALTTLARTTALYSSHFASRYTRIAGDNRK